MRRAFVTALFVCLALSLFTGCKPGFQGSLTGRDGNGQPPSPSPGQAQITALGPSTAVAGSASFTLTVNGLNFLPTTTVLWNDATLATTYVSSSVLQAQVPAALLAKPTSVTLTPSPQVTFNFGATFTVTVPPLTGNSSFSVSMVPVAANDIQWNPADQQFYLSIAAANSTNPNTITALNPLTGTLGTSVPTTSEPGKLAISSDGAFLYAGLDSAGSVQRYTLPALQPDLTIPLGSSTYGPFYAIDLQPQPASPHSIAVSRGVKGMSPRELGGVLIYDDAVARPQSVPGFGPGPGPIDALLWNPNGQQLYGLDTESGTGLYPMSVNTSGVQLQTAVSSGSLGNRLHFDSTTGLLYTDTGQVLDPTSGAPVGSFPLNTIQGGFSLNPIMVPDGKLNIAYFLGRTYYTATQGSYVLEAFDLTHFTFLGAIPLTNIAGTPSSMIRWGTNGLAVLTADPYGNGASGDGLYLITGAFVTSPTP